MSYAVRCGSKYARYKDQCGYILQWTDRAENAEAFELEGALEAAAEIQRDLRTANNDILPLVLPEVVRIP